ncbi:LPXTG cell wall anchor domain-containing protein [Streptomyces decoyicus]|uniref:LPXTG cell wall anchor domain-containing protein n=1 Tax=Streptomyces decoyicus TaxID=249567 RepID=UPI00386D0F6E
MALLSAPVAYAAGETPAPAGSHPAPAATASAPQLPAAGGTDGRPEAPAGRPTAEATTSGAAKSAASAPAQPSAEPSATYTRPTFCSGIPDEERGKTGLRDLPSKIVAGSGWHAFTYRVANVSKIKVMETDVSLALGTGDPKIEDVSELSVTVQWYNPATGKWKPVEGEGAAFGDDDEFATVKSLKPGEYADAKMRIKIGGKAKAGSGYFFTLGHSYGEDGQCGFDEISRFDFTVLPAGTRPPGKVEDAKGKPGKPGRPGTPGTVGQPGHAAQPGKGALRVSSQGALDELPVTGTLAATGSSDALPTVAAIGGAAVLAGVGTVFVVRRRRAGSVA